MHLSSSPRIAITAGEPSGIGPDLCIQLPFIKQNPNLIIIADPELLIQRAGQLNIDISINLFNSTVKQQNLDKNAITVFPLKLKHAVISGQVNKKNSPYVIESLNIATRGCLQGQFSAMVTAPVHKAIINEAGIPFTGHTEYIAGITGGHPVMMLATPGLRVALVTTHMPLSEVSKAITVVRLSQVIRLLDQDLRQRFAMTKPRIYVCGLNPHAGEMGHLGKQEIDIIEPVIEDLKRQGINLYGPYPADTVFTPKYLKTADVILAMYHDQGLPVLKHMGFGQAVNITLGLPIIRTSVDHGTALDLAGTGLANTSSMAYAIETALHMSLNKQNDT